MKRLSLPTSIPERPVFHAMDCDEPWTVPGYRRDLPHWRLPGATYFTTFRLADSIPESVARSWQNERHDWYRRHNIEPSWATSDPARFDVALLAIPAAERADFQRQQQRQFFIALDQCHGTCVLEKVPDLMGQTLLHFHGSRVWTGDFVVMPNHVHVIAQPFPGVALEDWLYSIKRFTSTQIQKVPELASQTNCRQGHLWQTESFDRVIRESSELTRTRRYIYKNPARLREGSYTLHEADWLDEFAMRPT